ncbi:MAG: response regulator [Planctomycetales bacterium]|nr:response regulator [Planctomycetales bacterium]
MRSFLSGYATVNAASDFGHGLLTKLGYMALQPIGPGRLRLRGSRPNWARTIFRWSHDNTSIEVGDDHPFLTNFLIDAGQLWQQNTSAESRMLRSGIWEVTGDGAQTIYLEAIAARHDDTPILVLHNLTVSEDNQPAILRSTRATTLQYEYELLNHQRLMEELERAKLAAEELSEAKGQFVANMSHEVRTPLTGIIGLATLLLESDLSHEQRQHMESIMDSSRALLRVVNDVLDFSKIEANKLEFEIAPFDPRSLVTSVLSRFRPQAEKKGISLRQEIAVDTPTVYFGDALRLRQVLDNLISNGIKFTQQGSVTLSVRHFARSAPNGPEDYLSFSVRDTGVGIETVKQQMIFESFTQADASTARQYGGTGLGLAIVSRLVKLMGGELKLVSAPGRGATFEFSIPQADRRTDSLPNHESTIRERVANGSGGPSSAISDQGQSKPAEDVELAPDQIHILLAEDHEINRMLVVRMLQRDGFQVTAVTNGREAVASALEQAFDVILMDCQMPELDGFAATAEIRRRELELGRRVPIIAITAHAMSGFREKCLQAGMNDYICKPFQPAELSEAVLRIVRERE